MTKADLKELAEYLDRGTPWEDTPSLPYTPAAGILFTAILGAIKRNADTLVIGKYGFKLYRNEIFLEEFLGDEIAEAKPSYATLMRMILSENPIISQYMKIVTEYEGDLIVSLENHTDT